MTRGPSESVVAAVDAPIPFLREHAGTLLRTIGPLILVSQLTMVPAQYFASGLSTLRGSEMLTGLLALYGVLLGGVCVFFLLSPIVSLAIYAIVDDLLAGRPPDLGRALRMPLHPLRWLTVTAVGVLAAFGSMFVVGAWIVSGFLSFVYPIVVVEGVAGVEAFRRSLIIARYGAGARWWTAPWTRMVMVGVVHLGLASALSSLASIPSWADMGWRAWRAFTQGGDAMAALQTFSPLSAVSTTLLGALARVVTDSYPCVATLLVYRDVRRRMAGEDLEARIGALEAAR